MVISEPKDIREYMCGLGAAVVNINVTFPINKVIFRQMLYGVQTKSAVNQLKLEGFRTLYRGIGPPLVQRSVCTSIMFGSFAQYKNLLDTNCEHLIANERTRFCLAALMAGSSEAVLTPLERIQMLLQDQQFHKQYNNTIDAFRKLKIYGIKEYYRGLTAILCRNGPSNVLYFTFRGELKVYLPDIKSNENIWWYEMVKDFLSGALVGALISSVFYPMNVIRTRMQTMPVGSQFISISEAFKQIYRERDRSIRKLFYGVHINYSRAFISWGIINACYELFRKFFYRSD